MAEIFHTSDFKRMFIHSLQFSNNIRGTWYLADETQIMSKISINISMKIRIIDFDFLMVFYVISACHITIAVDLIIV